MLFLLCQVGDGRFVIPGERIIEVLPMVSVSPMAGLPEGVAGVMQYRGVSIPVVDLTHLASGIPAPARMSTRLILVNTKTPDGQSQIFGLIAERATRMISLTADQFTNVTEDSNDLPFLGKVAWESGVALRQVDVDRIPQMVLAPQSRVKLPGGRQRKQVSA